MPLPPRTPSPNVAARSNRILPVIRPSKPRKTSTEVSMDREPSHAPSLVVSPPSEWSLLTAIKHVTDTPSDTSVNLPRSPTKEAQNAESNNRKPVNIVAPADQQLIPDRNLLAPPDDGRASRLSVKSVSAPVQCICVFVARSAKRNCQRKTRCQFAAAKFLGFCVFPLLILIWAAVWTVSILMLGGMFDSKAGGNSNSTSIHNASIHNKTVD